MSNTSTSFDSLYAHLLTLPAPLLPPGKSTDPALTDKISSLYVHPSLEAALHILNSDLPSAHFLARHMQNAPAYEGMYLHGILHRVEGDYDNARAWYGNVAESDVFLHAWPEDRGGKEGALGLIGEVEKLNKEGKGEKEKLEKQSVREIKAVVEWCVEKFGKEEWRDATKAWVKMSDEHRQMGEDMVSGDSGRRNF
ncbi:MAG: hypothetical protein M1827_003463 [Pycnora praestabilis]|nr:MAG: hypothetical protein M1827_003463 [Pycnora praestabilis]